MLDEIPPLQLRSDSIVFKRWPNKITHGDYAPFRAKVESVFTIGVVDVVKLPVLDGSSDREEKLTLRRHGRDRNARTLVYRLAI